MRRSTATAPAALTAKAAVIPRVTLRFSYGPSRNAIGLPPTIMPPAFCQAPESYLVQGGIKDALHPAGMFEHLAAPDSHAGERVVGDRHRQAGLVADLGVQAAQQRAPAGQHDALVGDVGGQNRRS